jgi:type I restriction enzyme S subunit
MKFSCYPNYKESGVEWIEKIPSQWKSGALRWLSQRYSGGTPDKSNHEFWENGSIPWLNSGSVNDKLILEPSAYITETAFNSSSAKWIPKGALVIALAGQGKTKGMVAQLGIDSTSNQSMAAIVPKEIIRSRYLYYWLESNYENIRNMAGGDLRDGLNLEMLGNIKCPIPSSNEQKIISNFLDEETAKIDTLFAAQEELIELLSEKRQAVISHAVTKGLNPNVKLKNSEVEWLGQIPEHWVVKKIKFVADVMASNVDKKTYEGDTPCLLCNYTDVYYNDQIIKDMEFMSATATPEQIIKFTLKKGDVIITKDSESPDDIAVAAFVPTDLIGVVCGYHLSIIRAFDINGMFVKRLFDSHYLKSKFATLANGLTRYGLGQHSINNAYIPIPPKEEQQQIVDFINKTCIGIDDLIDKSKTSMNLLIERRSALISAAVTGQIDVRNYQSKEVE